MSSAGALSQESLQAFKQAMAETDPQLQALLLQKAGAGAGWTQPGSATTGLQIYALDVPSKKLVPVITPIRNATPRASGGRSIQANWRAVTAINTAIQPATIAEGKRGGVVTTTTKDYLAAFKGIGLEDSVSFEAEYAADQFEDLRALAATNLLNALMIAEEQLLLGGNLTMAFGTCPTPVGTLNTDSVSAMTARAVVCYCVALTLDGYQRATVSAAGVIDQIARTNTGPYTSSDTINAGHGIISAEATAVTTDATHKSITWNVAATQGAFGYAWYTGLTGAANCKIAAVTTVNQFKQVANEGGSGQAANFTGSASDRSQNTLSFDGLVSIGLQSNANGYYKSLDGADLTSDNAGGIVEWDNALIDRWNNYRMSFTDVWVSGADIVKLTKKILASSNAAPIYSIFLDPTQSDSSLQGGGLIAKDYLNKITGTKLMIHVHPNVPAGKFVFTASTLPYPVSNIPAVFRVLCRQDYYAIEWPRLQRNYEYGVYSDEVLQHYFPPSIGIVDNGVLL